MQGQDLLDPEAEPRDVAMTEVHFGGLDGPSRFETAWGLPGHACQAVAFETGQRRFVHFASGHEPMLFDTQSDPGCQHNLAADEPDTVADMRQALLNHRMHVLG